MESLLPTQTGAKVHASEVSYELHTLGWKAFQSLCATIVGEIWGQSIQSFFDSNDGGRDGAFHGRIPSITDEFLDGSFTVQCKFTSKPEKPLNRSTLRDELEKAKCLAAKGLAKNYFLFTNHSLTGMQDERLRRAFLAIPGIEHFAAYGRERISQIIRESSRLRMLVPRIYGLGDLSQILDERAYAQAKAVLSSLGDDLAKFVLTDAYRKSAKAIVDHGFVLLLGEPASGKSMIAAALALGALDEWGCYTLKCRDAHEFVKHYNPHEPKQFFWVDDAFGATQFDWSSAGAWNSVFVTMQAAIRKGARVLFTSRDYIYKSARQHLKESAFPRLKESQVVIHVEDLTKEEREQILYNHVRFGDQTQEFKTKVKPFLANVASHPQFKPEIARRLGTQLFTSKLTLSKSSITGFVEHPVELLCEIIGDLDPACLAAIALVFMADGFLASPIDFNDGTNKTIELIGGTPATVRSAFEALEGTLLINCLHEGNYFWRFKHPTIRDAFAIVVSESRELLDVYLTGTPLLTLFREVSCGVDGIEGVKVVVPINRYPKIITRISLDWERYSRERDSMCWFLATRCDKEFFSQLIQIHPGFIDQLHVGSYLYAIVDVRVIARLHKLRLLPNEKYLSIVADLKELAVVTPDSGFLRDYVREFLGEENLQMILNEVRARLLPKLSDEIFDLRLNYRETDDPDNHFEELRSALKEYGEEFVDDSVASAQIEEALSSIKETIEELQNEQIQEPDCDDFRGGSLHEGHLEMERSTFDDVDQ